MAYWLVKTEPTDWSWDHHRKAGASAWTGVRNPAAQANLRAMKIGERAFFYHTGNEKRIVGIVEVTRAPYPDPTDKSGKAVAVDLKCDKPLPAPVTLAQVKAEPKLKNLALVRQTRLSVMPIDEKSWKMLCAMGKLKSS